MDAAHAAATRVSDPAFRAAVDRLRSRDQDTWRELLRVLGPITRALAASFRDVTTEEDVLGDLALAAHERWIAEWIDRAQRGVVRVPLLVFLRDRMRDQLREERRRRARREELLRALPSSMLATETEAPESIVAAAELRERATFGSPALDTVVGLREAGHDHREIAARTGSSPATVSRRLAAIAAVLVPLLVTAMLLWWTSQQQREVVTERLEVATPSVTGTAPMTSSPILPAPISPAAVDPDARGPAPSPSSAPSLPPSVHAAPGRLVVNALPWCQATIDGRAVGPTPVITTLPAGPHDVRCVAANGDAREADFVITPDETAHVILRFGD